MSSSGPPQTSSSSAGDFKKRQEDALKKQTGELPPDLDQDGKMINPHNPDFITKVPWYLGDSGPTLKHHSVQKEEHVLSMTETDELVAEKFRAQQQIRQAGTRVGVFKKGACKNCGSLSHKEKDCVERPRSIAKSAWKTGVGMAQANSDVQLELTKFGKVSYDGKRDQWAGYDPSEHRETVERYERLEEERRALAKAERRKAKEEAEAAEEARVLAVAMAEKSAVNGTKGVNGSVGIDSTVSNRDKKKRVVGSAGARQKQLRSRPAGQDQDQGSGNSEVDSDSDSDSDNDSSDHGEDSDSDDDAGGGGRRAQKEFNATDEQSKDFQSRQARQGGVGGAEMKITVRNLRIREDTPKYLRNLALESAHYDPKSRSMRANPNPDQNPESSLYAGDNFVRYSGDALALAKTQVLCWDLEQQQAGKSKDKGKDGDEEENDSQLAVDLLTNPSQAELVMKAYSSKKSVLERNQRLEILKKYGDSSSSGSSSSNAVNSDREGNGNMSIRDDDDDEEAEDARKRERGTQANTNSNSSATASAAVSVMAKLADPRLRLGQTETYQQYTSDGRVVKGPSAGPARSGATSHARTVGKYEEDCYINNHTSVWGSYYSRRTQKWGYECCHSLVYNSYCTGAVGKEANDAQQAGVMDINAAKKMVDFHAKEREKERESGGRGHEGYHPNSTKSSTHFGKSGLDLDGKHTVLDQSKLAAALSREGISSDGADGADGAGNAEGKKRRYNQHQSSSDGNTEVTAESLEAYRLKRSKAEDPMAMLLQGGSGSGNTSNDEVLLEYK